MPKPAGRIGYGSAAAPTGITVFVQFDKSVNTSGQATARIGTTSSYTINMEEDRDWGLAG
ncbi:MAG: hypothetical protein H0T05_01205 [Acidobacteria bacterium]|nr:hypothetical protein [Acidobacteriota bacterium]MBA3885252.1 hypothetical protein [Acidobacteriota bacterium]